MHLIAPNGLDTISTGERERRMKIVARAEANNRIEGLYHSSEAEVVIDAYVRGEIDVDELVPQLKAQLKLG